MQGGAGLPYDFDSKLFGTRGGLWLQDTWTPSDRLSLEPGLRLDWSTVNGGATVSPRMAGSYAIKGEARIRAAGGLYTQSPGYESSPSRTTSSTCRGRASWAFATSGPRILWWAWSKTSAPSSPLG